MAGYSIRLEGDASELLRTMRAYGALDKKRLNTVLAESARESTLERFQQGKGPDGKRWQSSIRAAATGGKTLVLTAQLRNSIRSYADEKGFAVGTNAKHAATHQFGESGRTIRAKTKKGLRFQAGGRWITKKQVRTRIPARPFLGFSDEDLAEFQGTVEDFIEQEV